MSRATRRENGASRASRRAATEQSPTAKVVWIELVRASGPLTPATLAERTLLARPAVESALADLVTAGLAAERPGDERRPPRYAVEEPPAAE